MTRLKGLLVVCFLVSCLKKKELNRGYLPSESHNFNAISLIKVSVETYLGHCDVPKSAHQM